MPRLLLAVFLIGLVFLSGCIIGGDKLSVARDLAQLREQAIEPGLLVPHTSEGRQQYRSALIGFRSRVDGVGDGKAQLQAYLDGSIDVIAMQESLNSAYELVKNINPSLVDCSADSAAEQALEHFHAAKEKSESAHIAFVVVHNDVALTNALGADYVINADATTAATGIGLTTTIEQIQDSCI